MSLIACVHAKGRVVLVQPHTQPANAPPPPLSRLVHKPHERVVEVVCVNQSPERNLQSVPLVADEVRICEIELDHPRRQNTHIAQGIEYLVGLDALPRHLPRIEMELDSAGVEFHHASCATWNLIGRQNPPIAPCTDFMIQVDHMPFPAAYTLSWMLHTASFVETNHTQSARD